MNIRKAVISAASRSQRHLPLQTLVDQDGQQKSVLHIIVGEAARAGVEEICVVVSPGDEEPYRQAAGEHATRVRFIPQEVPAGYGHAVFCAHDFIGEEPFLHMVGDHVYVSRDERSCAAQLVRAAGEQACSVSGVQATHESLLPYFGAVGGQRVRGAEGLYVIERVAEKPTPTEAEQALMVPGLRSGHYLCFFGMHVFTPAVMELLGKRVAESAGRARVELSPVLSELAARERYLALETKGRRYPVDVRYGLLTAQLALALAGPDRDEVLTALCELLARREVELTGR